MHPSKDQAHKAQAVRKVLGSLNKASANVNINKQLVEILVDELNLRLQNETGILKGATIRHSGSAYENLAVDDDADFDLILQLGEPFVSRNFEITQATESTRRYFSYNLKKGRGYTKKKDMFCSNKGNLKTEEFRKHIFDRLVELLGTLSIRDLTIQCQRKLAAMQLNLHLGNRSKVEVDLVPQIAVCRWDECPGLVPKSSLPLCLREYIENNERNNSPILFITPAVLNAHRSSEYTTKSMLSFSLLEKCFLKKEENIHDMVRLAKLIKDNQRWTEIYGLKSFHLKRMAIKNASSLKTMTTYDGLMALLGYMKEELTKKGGFIDCFVIEHYIYHGDHSVLFSRSLSEVQKWQPEKLENLV